MRIGTRVTYTPEYAKERSRTVDRSKPAAFYLNRSGTVLRCWGRASTYCISGMALVRWDDGETAKCAKAYLRRESN